nr:MAG TPA: hypothetical protein [Caudoviricetes sp.]
MSCFHFSSSYQCSFPKRTDRYSLRMQLCLE